MMRWTPNQQKQFTQILTFRTKTIIALFILILFLVAIFTPQAESQEPEFVAHVVVAGDSLWSIAGQYDTGMSRQEAVYYLREDNNTGPLIYPGQVLRVRITTQGRSKSWR